jgi:hypothetical protein
MAVWPAVASAGNPPAVTTDSAVVIGSGTAGPYWLSGFFILRQSDTAIVSGEPLIRDSDYAVDYNRGRISFTHALSSADTVIVRFSRLSFALAPSWAQSTDPSLSPVLATARNISAIERIPLPSPTASPTSATPTAPARLNWSGYKSFSFSADETRASDWSQGLELSAQGELLEGLSLNAAVSDRALGGGATQQDGTRLSDLDRVFIEANSSRFHGRWGELQRDAGNGRRAFASGLQAEWNGPRHGFSGYLMHAHGDWQRVRIAVRPNDAGPYPLSGSAGATAIVAGTQSVWLGGRRLSEGTDADYTLDLSRGALKLSPRLRIDQNAVLVVEYQQALADYQRTLAGSTWRWNRPDQKLGNSLSLSWEADDPSQPLFGALTAAQRQILASAVDGHAVLGAYEHTSGNDGEYRLDIRGNDSVFVYAGPGNGSWHVRFAWVGEGKGSYRHLVDDAYEYAGPGGGGYSPTLSLDAPRARFVADESMHWQSRGLGSLEADWQGVGDDPNRLSTGNATFASNHRLQWKQNWHDSLGAATLTWHRQGVADDVVSSEAKSYSDLTTFAQAWQMRSTVFAEKHDEIAASFATPLSPWLSLAGEGGRWSATGLAARRGAVNLSLMPSKDLSFAASVHRRWVDGSTAGNADARGYEATGRLGNTSLMADAGWREEDLSDSARQFESTTQYGSTRWIGAHALGLDLRNEWRLYREYGANTGERVRELSLTAPASVLCAQSGSGLALVRGERQVGAGGMTPYYGGRLNSQWRPTSRLQFSAQIQLTQLHAGAQREVYLPTRLGQGDYRLERGEYIPDPQGDYRRTIVEDEDATEAVYDGSRQLTVNWRPEFGGWHWTVDLSRRLDARYAPVVFSPAQWLLPWASEPEAIAPGARLSQHDDHRVSVQPRRQTRLSLTLSSDRQTIPQQGSSAGGYDERSRRIESEWREDLTSIAYVSFGGQFQTQARRGVMVAPLDADARALRATIGVNPQTGMGFSVETRRRIDRDFTLTNHIALWGIRPSTRLHRGMLSASLTGDFTWVVANQALLLSPLLAEGRPQGFSMTESAEVNMQLPSRLSVLLRLSGDQRRAEADRWRMYMETVARF